MKKWIVLVLLVGILSGCGSGGAKETSETKKQTETASTTAASSSKKATSSSEKKLKLTDVDFQVEGTAYKMKILDKWEILEDEEFSFSAGNEDEADGVMVYGIKKTDVNDIEILKNSLRDEYVAMDDFQIKEETIKEKAYQTSHYTGELHSFVGVAEGANAELRFYVLETETDYVVVNFFGLPSFFDRNEELVTEMMNSFVAV